MSVELNIHNWDRNHSNPDAKNIDSENYLKQPSKNTWNAFMFSVLDMIMDKDAKYSWYNFQ